MKGILLSLAVLLFLTARASILHAQTSSNLVIETYAGITLQGSLGDFYAVEATPDLDGMTNWQWAALLKLTTPSQIWFDRETPSRQHRFYRTFKPSVTPVPNMVFIQPGTFALGSSTASPDYNTNETPLTIVTLNFGFWMGMYEVTQEDYVAVTGLTNPSHWRGEPTLPVESVTWGDATNYCTILTARERMMGSIPTNFVYRLPTEAEWEHACRAGTTTRYSYGDDLDTTALERHAWYADNSDGETHPVGRRSPNPWGLYDMHGNVWEWCLDRYGSHPGGSVTEPTGPDSGSDRVNRGGSWFVEAVECRSASRRPYSPTRSSRGLGFRVVLAVQ